MLNANIDDRLRGILAILTIGSKGLAMYLDNPISKMRFAINIPMNM